MLRKIFTSLILICYLSVSGQGKLHEIGFFVGTSYYVGELNQDKVFYDPSPTFSFLYKVNLNHRFALRFNASYARLKGDDADSKHKYQLDRNHKFDINMTEFVSLIEFNFLSYKPSSRFEYFSPYITLGAGVLLMPSEEGKVPIHPVIPFGIGFKYAATPKLGIAVEWTYRKTFTDYIDQLAYQEYSETPSILNKQLTNNQNKDWYSFAGITLTYKFALGNTKCHAY